MPRESRGSGSLEAGVRAGSEPPHVGSGNAARVALEETSIDY